MSEIPPCRYLHTNHVNICTLTFVVSSVFNSQDLINGMIKFQQQPYKHSHTRLLYEHFTAKKPLTLRFLYTLARASMFLLFWF